MKQNKDCNTPLHLAVSSGCVECVALLLTRDSIGLLSVKNRHGETPQMMITNTRSRKGREMLDLLKEYNQEGNNSKKRQ